MAKFRIIAAVVVLLPAILHFPRNNDDNGAV